MKASHTLIFILSIFLILGTFWFLFPADGVKVAGLSLRFPSYAEARMGEKAEVDVDSVMNDVNKSFEMTCSKTTLDSLKFFRSYLTTNENRIYLPDNNYEYFDTLFALFESAKEEGKTYRVMHYGDSQIEMDRITSVLRQKLQELFGGSGPNMIPAIQTVPTISVSQQAAGLTRYTLYGDSTTRRAPHKRYGVLTQFSQSTGQSSINFRKSNHSYALDNVKKISKVSLLIGNNSEGFTASLKCDTIKGEKKVCHANAGVSLLTWNLPANVKRGTISMSGSAQIYAVLLDGGPGVNVDNAPLRGCSGTVFTRMDEKSLAQSYQLLDTRLILLQFGGNRMPGIHSTKNIPPYLKELERQIAYFREVAPQATLLFIGPADMGQSHNGKMGTWTLLPALNDSLRAMALRNNVAYWDMFHVMGGEGSMAQYVKHKPALAGPDYIHFTLNGAQHIGGALVKSFTTYYDFYRLRKHMPNDVVLEYIKHDAVEQSDKFTPGSYYDNKRPLILK